MSVKVKVNRILPDTIEALKQMLPKDVVQKIDMNTNENDILEILNRMNEAERAAFEKKHSEFICNEIKEKVAKNPSMNLVNEEVLEDGSVVITINV